MLRIRPFIVCLALAAIASPAFAQPSKVNSGALALQENKFDEALSEINEGLQKQDAFKPKQLAKAYFYQTQAYMGLARTAYMTGKPEQKESIKTKYPNLLADAYGAIENLRKYDEDGGYGNQLKVEKTILSSLLIQAAQDKMTQKPPKPDDALRLIDGSESLAKDIGQPNFLAPYIRANVLLSKRTAADSTAALAQLERVEPEFEKFVGAQQAIPKDTLRKQFGPQMAQTQAQLVYLYAFHKKDSEKAMQLVDAAKAKYPGNADLERAELAVYDQPELFDKALGKFEEAIKKNPNDELVILRYAGMMEKKAEMDKKRGDEAAAKASIDKAIAIYKQVVSVAKDAENKKTANFNIGAIYNNMAVETIKKMNDLPMDKQEEYDALAVKKKEYLTSALPYMKAAFEADNKNKVLLRNIIGVLTDLGDMAELEKYKKIEESLK